jgi:hypothetical protein
MMGEVVQREDNLKNDLLYAALIIILHFWEGGISW